MIFHSAQEASSCSNSLRICAKLTRALVSCIALIFLPLTSTYTFAQTVEEELLFKSAYIFNFAKFTTWPENKQLSERSTIKLCTIGNTPLVENLAALNNKKIQDRTLNVIHLNNTATVVECHLIYIGQTRLDQIKHTINAATGNPVLTISEHPSFTDIGGMIELLHTNGTTKFRINLSSVENNGLKISSRLLILATIIHQDSNK